MLLNRVLCAILPQGVSSIGSGSSTNLGTASAETSKLNGGTSTAATLQQATADGFGPAAGVLQTGVLADVQGPGRQSTTSANGSSGFLSGGTGRSIGASQQAASATANENGGIGTFHGNAVVGSEGPAGTSVAFQVGQQNTH